MVFFCRHCKDALLTAIIRLPVLPGQLGVALTICIGELKLLCYPLNVLAQDQGHGGFSKLSTFKTSVVSLPFIFFRNKGTVSDIKVA